MNKVKDVVKSIIENKKIVSIIMAVITYFVISLKGIIGTYDVISWFIFICLIILYLKTDIYNKEFKKDIIFLSLLFTFLLVFGSIVYSFQQEAGKSVFIELFKLRTLLSFIGIFNLIYVVLVNIFPKLYNFKIKNFNDNKRLNSSLVFIISFIVIMICYMPYFLRFYPGALSPDSIGELSTVINNFSSVSDHHPVIHILFISIPYNIGVKLFGNVYAGVAFSTITQMIIMACIFSSLIVFLKKRNVNKYILLLVLLYYALVPMHGFYSIVMWKDVIFSGTLLVLTMETIKILEKENNLRFSDMISFIIASIFCVFFRNNAIYMYVIFSIFSLFIFRKKIKYFISAFIIVFGVYIIIKGPVFNYFNVSKSASSEYIGMPLQQIGRMAFKNIEFTEYEKEELDKLIPVEIMKTSYNPQVSDGIKFNSNYNASVFDNNKIKYFKIWLGLVLEHPTTALEAYATSTLGYWYPGVGYWSVANDICENEYGLEVSSKLPQKYNKIFTIIESRGMPILCIEWSIGLCFWIIFIFGYIIKKKKGIKYLYPYIPVFGIWVTMLVASPVYAEFRYVYGAFTCLPLLMIMPYLKLMKKA